MTMVRTITLLFIHAIPLWGQPVEVASLNDLASAASLSHQEIRLRPGVYRMADYLTGTVLEAIRKDRTGKPEAERPPVPMFVFKGNGNRIDCRDAVIEIDTSLYQKLPPGYTRCIIVEGRENTITGLSIRNTGANRGSGGNILSLAGDCTTLEDVTLHVSGSYPYGYGDLFGKGGPNLVSRQKQSGIQIIGNGSVVRRCRVYSRAFGHCFYIQDGEGIRIEDSYAEGTMRATIDMLRETEGVACDLGFRSVYENRDGRYSIAPGYVKSLVEDGFRTYGSAGRVTLVNCTAVNTRAGFEIGAPDDATENSLLENCVARGCERAFLIGSNTVIRRGRGDIVHGPLLYLRGGRGSEVDLELTGNEPESLVHAVATIAGEGHKVVLKRQQGEVALPALPILIGFGMPDHGEMSSPIRPASASGIILRNEIAFLPVIESDLAEECEVQTAGREFKEQFLRGQVGTWQHSPVKTHSAK